MESLPTTKRGGARSKPVQTSKSSLVMAFFSCVAWLYVAGRYAIIVFSKLLLDPSNKSLLIRDSQRDSAVRFQRNGFSLFFCCFGIVRLWQDAENRNLLASLLKKNSAQRPKVLTVEDKLMVLGCRDLERRIVEAEMELSLAKSQGYLKGQGQKSSSSDPRFLAVIGVYTGFGSKLKRNIFRGSWMPRGDALKKLEERGVVIRFVIGRSANRGDSLDRNIDEENRTTKDFLILEGHEEAQEELPKKVKTFFSTAVQNWDADFYVKVDDGIDIDLEGLIELLDRRRGQDGAYVGCMKSGEVISEDVSLKTYGYDDTSLGSWMMGIQATYIDDSRLCCSSIRQGEIPKTMTSYPLGRLSLSLDSFILFHHTLHGFGVCDERSEKPSLQSLDDIDPELLCYFDKLIVPLNEQKHLTKRLHRCRPR
ncbi:hypothetical protein JHK84_048297 [Glycine max]|nr:hypothetical protein JHK86_048267 [Glycine max]KAG5103328.1 hypothetical protein JHK84_048297 [Glycine max]